jgi:hypothetical protein
MVSYQFDKTVVGCLIKCSVDAEDPSEDSDDAMECMRHGGKLPLASNTFKLIMTVLLGLILLAFCGLYS